ARLVAVLVTLSGPSAGGTGADPAVVEVLIREGTAFRRDGKDDQNFPLFRKAYELAPTPRTAAQLGLVEMELSYWLEAEKHLSEALAAPRDLWVNRNRETLAAALQQVTAS